jgi:hypothetical protein
MTNEKHYMSKKNSQLIFKATWNNLCTVLLQIYVHLYEILHGFYGVYTAYVL